MVVAIVLEGITPRPCWLGPCEERAERAAAAADDAAALVGAEGVEACDEAASATADDTGDAADEVSDDWAALRDDSAAAAADTAGTMGKLVGIEDGNGATIGTTLDVGCVVRA